MKNVSAIEQFDFINECIARKDYKRMVSMYPLSIIKVGEPSVELMELAITKYGDSDDMLFRFYNPYISDKFITEQMMNPKTAHRIKLIKNPSSSLKILACVSCPELTEEFEFTESEKIIFNELMNQRTSRPSYKILFK